MGFFSTPQRGFSLIELLIAISIVSLLTMIGFSSYSHHLAHAKRLQAANQLSQLAIVMEAYHFEHGSYENASLASLYTPPKDFPYEFVLASATADDFVLMAKPVGAQAEKDRACGALIVNARGEKKISGEGVVEECW